MPTPDEGYLWYGALRTLAGEVPLRDFRSYEPGRYYWCALWMLGLGRGLVQLRVVVHTFYFLGLTSGLLALRSGGAGWPAVAAAAVILVAWEHKPYTLFEPALGMFAVLAGVLLILHPGYGSILMAGVCVGVVAFFGVNYGLYTGAALFGLTVLESLKTTSVALFPGIGAFALGALIGSLPLLVMFVCVRGVFTTFLERRVRAVAARRSSNLPLRVPWPWRQAPATVYGFGSSGIRLIEYSIGKVVGLLFLLLPVFAWSVAIWVVISPWSEIQDHAALAAAAAFGAFNLHHAFSRADLFHLPQAMPALVLGVFALAGHGLDFIVPALLLGAATAVVVISTHPRIERRRHRSDYARHDIAGSPVWIRRSSAEFVDRLSAIVKARLRPGDPLLAVPVLAELLPILDRRSAVYDTYCVYPANAQEQERMLRSIDEQHVRLAFVSEYGVDGRDDLRFPNSHPLVWARIESEFERLEVAELPPTFNVFYRE